MRKPHNSPYNEIQIKKVKQYRIKQTQVDINLGLSNLRQWNLG